MLAQWKPIPRSFYRRPTLDVARDLVGTVLVRRLRGRDIAGRVVEVEAYIGEDDPACHAFHGRTARTDVMYGPPGHAYVYFTYGMHFMLNVVTEREGFPAAVLFRALQPLLGLSSMRERRRGAPDSLLTNGPARLCAALGVDLRLNRCDLTRGPLFLAEAQGPPPRESIVWTARVGIRDGLDRIWRCYERGNAFVSKGRPGVPPKRKGGPLGPSTLFKARSGISTKNPHGVRRPRHGRD